MASGQADNPTLPEKRSAWVCECADCTEVRKAIGRDRKCVVPEPPKSFLEQLDEDIAGRD